VDSHTRVATTSLKRSTWTLGPSADLSLGVRVSSRGVRTSLFLSNTSSVVCACALLYCVKLCVFLVRVSLHLGREAGVRRVCTALLVVPLDALMNLAIFSLRKRLYFAWAEMTQHCSTILSCLRSLLSTFSRFFSRTCARARCTALVDQVGRGHRSVCA